MSATEPPAPPARLFTAAYLRLFAGKFCFMMCMAIFFLLPHYLELRGTSQSFYGAVAGSIGLTSFLSVVALGYRGDVWSRKTTVLVYLVPTLLGNVAALLAMEASPAWYFLTRMLHGVTMGLGFPVIFTWVAELSPAARRTEALAYFGMAGLTASTAGPLLGELILQAQGTPVRAGHYFWVFAAATGLVGLAALLIATVPTTRAARAGEGDAGLLPLLRQPAPRLALLVILGFGGVFGGLMAFGKTHAAALHLEFASILYGAFTGGAILSRIFIRGLLHTLSQTHLIPIGLAGVAAGFVLLGLAGGYPLLAAAGLVYGLSHGVLYPSLNVRFFDFFTRAELGRASILYVGAFNAGVGLFPYWGGTVAGHTGFATLFYLFAAIALAAIGLHWQVERLHARPRR